MVSLVGRAFSYPRNSSVLDRCAVVAGTGLGGVASFHEQNRLFIEDGPCALSPRGIPMLMPNATAAVIAMRVGWRGPNICIATACASGTHAVGEGARLIREGAADAVLAGATEAAVTPVALSAFACMGALSTRNDHPEQASRPFDAIRDGFVLGEGAAFVVLESYSHAMVRNARIYGEVAGYGRNSDAFHITTPAPDGDGAVSCMRLALADAGVDPAGIGHINAHGTSTPLNDLTEAKAIRTVFGDDGPPVTSIKGATGHLIGAAGAARSSHPCWPFETVSCRRRPTMSSWIPDLSLTSSPAFPVRLAGGRFCRIPSVSADTMPR